MNPNLSSDSVFAVQSLSRVQLFGFPWSAAHQALLSMEFSRQEYWSELPIPSPGDLPDPGVEPWSPALQADSLPSEPPEELESSVGRCCDSYFTGAETKIQRI